MLFSAHSMAVALGNSLQPWSPSQGQANKLSQNSSTQYYLDSVGTTTVITPNKGNLADAQGKDFEMVVSQYYSVCLY